MQSQPNLLMEVPRLISISAASLRGRKFLPVILVASFLSLIISTFSYGRIGDEWITTRGDDTPHQRYTHAVITTSGRIIGMDTGGNMAWSDDSGTNWSFGRVEINGLPVRGVITVLYQRPGGSLMAVLVKLEENTGGTGTFNYYVRSYILTSSNNGSSWSMTPFPKTFAYHSDTGRNYYGVNISGFHEGPGGELLAYGTTTGTNTPGFMYWHIGGAIFREAGGSWEQANFGYGPVGKITTANGRAVAVSHNAVLDSGDGAGWNGYSMGFSQATLNGALMPTEDRYRLRLLDVEYIDNHYVAQGAIFVPYQGSFRIDTPYLERAFKMSAATPFDAGRLWTVYEEPYRGLYTKSGNNIIAARPGRVWVTGSAGAGFTLASDEINASGQAFATTGSSTVYAVESSETVWKSTSAGAAWEKIWDKDIGGNLTILGYYEGVVYARDGYNRQLWVSYDNGQSWQQRLTNFSGYGKLIVDDDGRLMLSGGSPGILTSTDGGFTWESLPISENLGAGFLLKSKTGRLHVPAVGRSVQNEGVFYYSDDKGETWKTSVANTIWGEGPNEIVQCQSGRILVPVNNFASFDNRLLYSDDDGETWSVTDVLQTTEGLDHVSGDPTEKVIDVMRMSVSKTGRVFLMGGNEIITSDDEGMTWDVRVNMDYGYTGPWLNEDLYDIIQAGDRWFAIGSWETPYPQSRNRFFLLVSDDDGSTWGQVPFETNLDSTYLYDLAVTEDGRLMITGNNGAVFVSDPEKPMPVDTPDFTIREGTLGMIPVERPDVDGPISAHYGLVGSTAINGTDFITNSGGITWGEDDTATKFIEVETIDNTKIDSARDFFLQLIFETQDGFVGTIDATIGIEDDDINGPYGLLIEKSDELYTTEQGGSVDILVSLEGIPLNDVNIMVAGLDTTEGSLSTNTLLFTRDNWNKQQKITVTGIDDSFPDGDSTYNLQFIISETRDSRYAALPATKFPITNIGDEAYEVGGDKIDGIIRGLSTLAITSGPGSTNLFTFRIPVSTLDLTLSSEISTDMDNWSPGPAPVQGETANGFTTYTLTISETGLPYFFRVRFDTGL